MAEHVIRFLIVGAGGDCRVVVQQPRRKPGEAVYRLRLNLPAETTFDGEIEITIPDGTQHEIEIEEVSEALQSFYECPECGLLLSYVYGPYEFESGESIRQWHWRCSEHGRYLETVLAALGVEPRTIGSD